MYFFWQRMAPFRLDPEGRTVFQLPGQNQAELTWLAPCNRKNSDFWVAYIKERYLQSFKSQLAVKHMCAETSQDKTVKNIIQKRKLKHLSLLLETGSSTCEGVIAQQSYMSNMTVVNTFSAQFKRFSFAQFKGFWFSFRKESLLLEKGSSTCEGGIAQQQSTPLKIYCSNVFCLVQTIFILETESSICAL